MQLIILRMQEPPSDLNLSPSAAIEKYNDINIPFDPAVLTFPQQLFHLLQIAENSQREDTISWAEDGKSFTVHDPNEFEATLLIKYFQMKKYASFTRQLCAYGFSCVRKGRKPGLYYHPNFVRDNYDACSRITRGSGKEYPKKSVTYTGEMAEPPPSIPLLPGSGWNLEKNLFPSTSVETIDTRKRNKKSGTFHPPTSTNAFATTPTLQELRNNLDRATMSPVKSERSWGETTSPRRSYSPAEPPPRADTATSSSSITQFMGASALQDDHQQGPGPLIARSQDLTTENASSPRQREISVTDVSLLLEPRSIQDMLDAPDFSWDRRKREREP